MACKIHYWRQAAIEFDLHILVCDPAVAPELGWRGVGGARKPTHILSISKGKFDSSYRTKEEEIEEKENQRKSDLDSRGSDVSFIAGWRPPVSQMKGVFVFKYLWGRGKALIGGGRLRLQQSCWEIGTRLPGYLFPIVKVFCITDLRWKVVVLTSRSGSQTRKLAAFSKSMQLGGGPQNGVRRG